MAVKDATKAVIIALVSISYSRFFSLMGRHAVANHRCQRAARFNLVLEILLFDGRSNPVLPRGEVRFNLVLEILLFDGDPQNP